MIPMPPLPLVALLVARNFDGAITSRFGTAVAEQLARRTKDEQVPICRDQVSLQSTSRQSFCSTDPAEPGDAHRFGTEIIGVRTSMHHYHNVVEQFLRKHRQTHAHAHARAHADAHARARARAHACELELVHVSLNSLTLFFVGEGRWFLHVF